MPAGGGVLLQDACGLSIKDEIEKRTGRSVTISTVHATLIRLEEKGMLKSYMGGATELRGGRTKRLFKLTAYGKIAINDARELRNKMWQDIPQLIWETKA